MHNPKMAQAFCDAIVTHPEMPNPAAKIGAWLISASQHLGGFPVQLSYREIEIGFTIEDKFIPGTKNHSTTIRKALEWLNAAGIFNVTEGLPSGFGYKARMIEWAGE